MSKLVVIAVQAKKDEPYNPDNKIAFTMDGALCSVTNPHAAHTIIKQAAAVTDYEAIKDKDTYIAQIRLFNEVGRILAGHRELQHIAKRV